MHCHAQSFGVRTQRSQKRQRDDVRDVTTRQGGFDGSLCEIRVAGWCSSLMWSASGSKWSVLMLRIVMQDGEALKFIHR